MVVYCVEVYVKPENEAEFLKITEKNHIETRKETGNIRFDFSKSNDTEGLFFLYEVFKDEEAVAAHKTTAHYAEWKKKVEPWMAKPRNGRKFTSLQPSVDTDW